MRVVGSLKVVITTHPIKSHNYDVDSTGTYFATHVLATTLIEKIPSVLFYYMSSLGAVHPFPSLC